MEWSIMRSAIVRNPLSIRGKRPVMLSAEGKKICGNYYCFDNLTYDPGLSAQACLGLKTSLPFALIRADCRCLAQRLVS